jgi:hypothetical protein
MTYFYLQEKYEIPLLKDTSQYVPPSSTLIISEY